MAADEKEKDKTLLLDKELLSSQATLLPDTVFSLSPAVPDSRDRQSVLDMAGNSLADNAILGIVLGVCLAFPVLVLSTCNVINGLLATLTICCVTVCVIGVLPMAGWKLGVLESLNMCLVVGLSVDYVVHLAEGYHMSTQSTEGVTREDGHLCVFWSVHDTGGVRLHVACTDTVLLPVRLVHVLHHRLLATLLPGSLRHSHGHCGTTGRFWRHPGSDSRMLSPLQRLASTASSETTQI
ncbi:hypothetical protein BaRGS_00020347 [Batillaria attramentaria]|uniref:Uncharacterized protein n=1 Tax=Batillaria attramentaria TaxID=370345 RepID=A0ABD0KMW1_9CAEN